MFDLGPLQLLASLVSAPGTQVTLPAAPTPGDDGAILLFLVAASIAALALLVRPEPR